MLGPKLGIDDGGSLWVGVSDGERDGTVVGAWLGAVEGLAEGDLLGIDEVVGRPVG